jgi:hypothetical protein
MRYSFISTLLARNGLLYTLNGQCKEGQWRELEGDLRTAAQSFCVFEQKASVLGWGTQRY